MTSTSAATAVRPAVRPGGRPAGPATCCSRTMSSIEVTTRGSALVLHSCTACGRHVWEKDGQTADQAALLDGVRVFLEQPRVPTPRRSSKRR